MLAAPVHALKRINWVPAVRPDAHGVSEADLANLIPLNDSVEVRWGRQGLVWSFVAHAGGGLGWREGCGSGLRWPRSGEQLGAEGAFAGGA